MQVCLHLGKQPSAVPFAAEVIGLHEYVALRSGHTGTQRALQPPGTATWPPPSQPCLMSMCILMILSPFFVVDVVWGSVGTQKAVQATTAASPQHTRHTGRVFFLCATPPRPRSSQLTVGPPGTPPGPHERATRAHKCESAHHTGTRHTETTTRCAARRRTSLQRRCARATTTSHCTSHRLLSSQQNHEAVYDRIQLRQMHVTRLWYLVHARHYVCPDVARRPSLRIVPRARQRQLPSSVLITMSTPPLLCRTCGWTSGGAAVPGMCAGAHDWDAQAARAGGELQHSAGAAEDDHQLQSGASTHSRPPP